jgi:hypothetical protein
VNVHVTSGSTRKGEYSNINFRMLKLHLKILKVKKKYINKNAECSLEKKDEISDRIRYLIHKMRISKSSA